MNQIIFQQNDIRTPNTVLVRHSEGAEEAAERLGNTFPMILKTAVGSRGVGVIWVESLKSLHSIVQLLYREDEYVDVLLQEYIKTDYDVRVIILDNKVLGAMKRNVITGDIRSNVSMGAIAEKIDLTELEISDSIKAAKATEGRLVGVDFIPSKNREKEQPYILEVNSMPGFGGIEKLQKGLTADILTHFKNRDNWR